VSGVPKAHPTHTTDRKSPFGHSFITSDQKTREWGRNLSPGVNSLMEHEHGSDKEEEEPAILLTTWLGNLNTLKKGLNTSKEEEINQDLIRMQQPGGVQMRSKEVGEGLVDKTQYRCSLINLEESQDDELDAILGELSELETQFSKEITIEEKKRSVDDHCVGQIYATIGPSDQDSGGSGGRNGSPDTDSAFCDNLSLVSSCSEGSSNKTDQSKKSSGVSSSTSNIQGPKSTQDAKIKAEKIKVAIEKIKEASVKKLFIKVFTSDGSAKSLLVDEKMTVGLVTRILAEKNHVSLDPKWALVELVPDLYMERVYEDNEHLVENCLLWKVDSKNTLWFIERPEKYDLFLRPEIYLLGSSSSQKDEPMEEHCRQELVEEYFSSSGVGAPQIEGYIWLKAENKKTWKKFHFILRTSGLYYSPKGKKTSKDLLCLCTFDVNQVYYGVGWKRKFKAPTDFCFGIKHPQIQAKNPKYIKYLCVDTQKELHQWVTGIRMAKNGKNLHDNYRSLVDEITHAEVDMLVGKRGSTNSAMGCLVAGHPKAESCLTNINLSSPLNATTPVSENKSFDSALSSGIRSDHFLEAFPASTTDLDKFDMKVNNISLSTLKQAQDMRTSTLGRTSKSSSSLSDKSSGIEQGFESDHPVGGTIKKRPQQAFPIAGNSLQNSDCASISIGAGGTLLRRSNSAERLTAGRNYEELQQLLDELHTNVKQAKDIQAKIKCSIEDSGGVAETIFPPPPGLEAPPSPPPRTSSRFSIDEDSLPPPPPELQSCASQISTLPRNHLPPIAPKPSLLRVPGSPKFKHSYGTLPNPKPKKSASFNCDQNQNTLKFHKSDRRISFDDQIQMIDDCKLKKCSELNQPNPHHKLEFIQGLERVVGDRLPPQSPPCFNKNNSITQKHCSGNVHSTSHGLSCSEPLYTAVNKGGQPHSVSGRTRYMPGSPAPGSRVNPVVCCVSSVKGCNSPLAGSGDSCGSSPETGRYSKGEIYRSWRAGDPGPGDYWKAESPGSSAPQNIWTARGASEEPRVPSDDLPSCMVGRPKHSSVPSSPVSSSPASRLWGSFRGNKKINGGHQSTPKGPPSIDKRVLTNPYLKSAS